MTLAASIALTDVLADAAIACDSAHPLEDKKVETSTLPLLNSIQYSGNISISTPEGFAYYALHPLDYADLVSKTELNEQRAFVVGVRSIGTTLSAIVTAKLRSQDIAAERITVRPAGHPYDRSCDFDFVQRERIAAALAAEAVFLICDEGPGRSGSSLLSVAEALERAGVPTSRIRILCSHSPDGRQLCGRDAERRWNRYRSAATGMTTRLPSDAGDFLGGGEWRRHLIATGQQWPGFWPQMERLSYLSGDGKSFLIFEGHGSYGAAARERSRALTAAEYIPEYVGQEQGFGRYRIPKTISAGADAALLETLAEYCGWRAREFRVSAADSSALEEMTRLNHERELKTDLTDFHLPVEQPCICDSRMHPAYWVCSRAGKWLKLDAALHGDDHFFPGPCDIAWDLAGVIVEWNLSEAARDLFLSAYERCSGDCARRRVEAYETAYATFSLAWSAMAAASMDECEEQCRLLADRQRYRKWVDTRAARQDCKAMIATAGDSVNVDRNYEL